MEDMSYPERAAYILGKFLSDYTAEELLSDCTAAYSDTSFQGGAAPLKKVTDSIFSLELWHGPTCAFKDMALQIMPRLLSRALTMTGEQKLAHILVATSGDTGKAALEGFKDVDGTRIIVFYPKDLFKDELHFKDEYLEKVGETKKDNSAAGKRCRADTESRDRPSAKSDLQPYISHGIYRDLHGRACRPRHKSTRL